MHTIPSSHRIARFGVFELDPRTGELRRRGVRIALQEQPFQLLALLVERAGDLVTREEVRRRLWNDSVFVAVDQALNTAVAKIRRALGDSAQSPRYVETLGRRGYRFLASVEWVGTTPAGIVWLAMDDRTIMLTDGEHVIGRDPDTAVCLPSTIVSRRHARLVVRGDVVTIEDLGSRNGTFVNGQRLAGTRSLSQDDEVRLGTLAMVVRLANPDTPTRSVDESS